MRELFPNGELAEPLIELQEFFVWESELFTFLSLKNNSINLYIFGFVDFADTSTWCKNHFLFIIKKFNSKNNFQF